MFSTFWQKHNASIFSEKIVTLVVKKGDFSETSETSSITAMYQNT